MAGLVAALFLCGMASAQQVTVTPLPPPGPVDRAPQPPAPPPPGPSSLPDDILRAVEEAPDSPAPAPRPGTVEAATDAGTGPPPAAPGRLSPPPARPRDTASEVPAETAARVAPPPPRPSLRPEPESGADPAAPGDDPTEIESGTASDTPARPPLAAAPPRPRARSEAPSPGTVRPPVEPVAPRPGAEPEPEPDPAEAEPFPDRAGRPGESAPLTGRPPPARPRMAPDSAAEASADPASGIAPEAAILTPQADPPAAPLPAVHRSPSAPRSAAPPRPRPAVLRAALRRDPPAPALPAPAPSRTATICEDPRLTGQRVTAITSPTRGCGIPTPVRVSAISGVRLDRPVVANCALARNFADWIETAARPAARELGSELASLRIAASYACRTRNSRPGARISEHGRGNAVDISAFRLADGREITVLAGWGRREEGRFLRRLHRSACGIFGTVLGPDSDRWHRNHFHFDIASHRSGGYCR